MRAFTKIQIVKTSHAMLHARCALSIRPLNPPSLFLVFKKHQSMPAPSQCKFRHTSLRRVAGQREDLLSIVGHEVDGIDISKAGAAEGTDLVALAVASNASGALGGVLIVELGVGQEDAALGVECQEDVAVDGLREQGVAIRGDGLDGVAWGAGGAGRVVAVVASLVDGHGRGSEGEGGEDGDGEDLHV